MSYLLYYSCTPTSVIEASTPVFYHPRVKTHKYPDKGFHPVFPTCFFFLLMHRVISAVLMKSIYSLCCPNSCLSFSHSIQLQIYEINCMLIRVIPAICMANSRELLDCN